MLRQVQRKTKLTTWQGIYKTRVKVHVVGLNFWQVFYSSRAFQEKQCEGISAKYSNTFAYTCSSYLEKHSNWTIQCKRFLRATKYYGHSNHVPAKFTWSKVLSRHLCVIAAPDIRTNPTLNVDRLRYCLFLAKCLREICSFNFLIQQILHKNSVIDSKKLFKLHVASITASLI